MYGEACVDVSTVRQIQEAEMGRVALNDVQTCTTVMPHTFHQVVELIMQQQMNYAPAVPSVRAV